MISRHNENEDFFICSDYAFCLLMRNPIINYRINNCNLADKDDLVNQCFIDDAWKRYDAKSMKAISMKGIMTRYMYKLMYGKQWETKLNFYNQLYEDFDAIAFQQYNEIDEVDAFMKYLNAIDDSLDKEILIKRFILDMSWKEIAESIGTSQSQPSMRFYNMKEYLTEIAK